MQPSFSRVLTAMPTSAMRARARTLLHIVRTAHAPRPHSADAAPQHAPNPALPALPCSTPSLPTHLMQMADDDELRTHAALPPHAAPTHGHAHLLARLRLSLPARPHRHEPRPRPTTSLGIGGAPARANSLWNRNNRHAACMQPIAHLCITIHGACPARHPATLGMRSALNNGCLMGLHLLSSSIHTN